MSVVLYGLLEWVVKDCYVLSARRLSKGLVCSRLGKYLDPTHTDAVRVQNFVMTVSIQTMLEIVQLQLIIQMKLHLVWK